MAKKIQIRVYGYGGEIVQDTYEDHEIQQIEDYLEENGEELINVMAEIEEILPDRYGWYECDGVSHTYGGFMDSCKVSIGIDDEWTDYDGEYPFNDIEELGADMTYEEVGYFDGDADVITIMSEEKGVFLDCTFEIEGEFDYSKLTFGTTDVVFQHMDTGDNEVYFYEQSILTRILYDGEEVSDFGGDTRGKGMYAYIQRKNTETAE